MYEIQQLFLLMEFFQLFSQVKSSFIGNPQYAQDIQRSDILLLRGHGVTIYIDKRQVCTLNTECLCSAVFTDISETSCDTLSHPQILHVCRAVAFNL